MAVTLDVKGQATAIAQGAGTNINVGNNSNRVLICVVQSGASGTMSATYASVAMSVLGTFTPTGATENEVYTIFFLAAPTTGINSFVCSYSPSPNNYYMNYYSFFNASQTTPASNFSALGTTTETATLTANGDEYGVGLAGSGFVVPTGYSLTGDASSNQLTLNQWFTGDTNGIVASGSRTAVANWTAGTSQVAAAIVLVGPNPVASTSRHDYLLIMGLG